MASGIDADVAVVGAGPAGTAAALFAARRGYRVIVFDKRAFPRDKPCGEGLMPGGRPALRELGLEDAIVSGGAPPLQGRSEERRVGRERGEGLREGNGGRVVRVAL